MGKWLLNVSDISQRIPITLHLYKLEVLCDFENFTKFHSNKLGLKSNSIASIWCWKKTGKLHLWTESLRVRLVLLISTGSPTQGQSNFVWTSQFVSFYLELYKIKFKNVIRTSKFKFSVLGLCGSDSKWYDILSKLIGLYIAGRLGLLG